MNTIRGLSAAAMCLICLAPAPRAVAAELKLPNEGWASWEVSAVEDAPAWCCFDRADGSNTHRAPCALDRGSSTIGGRDDETTDSIRVYAHVAGGKIERLRALSTTCPVRSDTKIQDLGSVSAESSARWLSTLVKERELETSAHRQVVEHALAALAVHRGSVAHDELVAIARQDARNEYRKQAVFWLAHLRGREGAQVATSIMFEDSNADIREHAAFAVSQSKSPSADKDLIRLATTDPAAKVRSHAWFSLSQTGSPYMEEAVEAALRKEADRDVREQAIFALSQLPDERATRALIQVAEDRSLAREERKRAVFWLSHSESSAAQTYLEAMLTQVSD